MRVCQRNLTPVSHLQQGLACPDSCPASTLSTSKPPNSSTWRYLPTYLGDLSFRRAGARGDGDWGGLGGALKWALLRHRRQNLHTTLPCGNGSITSDVTTYSWFVVGKGWKPYAAAENTRSGVLGPWSGRSRLPWIQCSRSRLARMYGVLSCHLSLPEVLGRFASCGGRPQCHVRRYRPYRTTWVGTYRIKHHQHAPNPVPR